MAAASPTVILDSTTIGEMNLSPDQQACLARLTQRKVKTFTPYYSRIIFAAERTGAGPVFTYVIPAGLKASAWGYGLGDSIGPSGVIGNAAAIAAVVAAIPKATKAETNITKKSETNSGENVRIMGISAQLNPGHGSSVLLAKEVMLNAWCDMIFGSDNHYVLGRLHKFGGANGVFGFADDNTGMSLNGLPVSRGHVSLGRPAWDNFIQIPEGVIWRDSDQDSTMTLEVTLERGLNFEVDTSFGAAGFTPPAFIAAIIDFELIGPVFGNRSDIS